MKKCPICKAKLINSNICINPECTIGSTAVFTLYKNNVKYTLTKNGLVEESNQISTTEDNKE